jgi:hypothetical protein
MRTGIVCMVLARHAVGGGGGWRWECAVDGTTYWRSTPAKLGKAHKVTLLTMLHRAMLSGGLSHLVRIHAAVCASWTALTNVYGQNANVLTSTVFPTHLNPCCCSRTLSIG